MVKPISSRRILKLFLFNPKQPTTPTTTHFQILHFSTFHPPPSPSYPSRRHEEESRNVRVSVWWDFENCSLPNGANVFKVAQCITAAIRANGIKGSIQITAFGDVMQLSRPNQEALSSTGINLTHIPHGGKNSADRSLLVDLMYWVSQNPPPAHLFLISGDRDFASILHRLRMNNYNILLASPAESAPGVLCSAASIMWQWNALVRGENLTGKHFNQPPDGPYGSWYGHYRAPLEDPFAVNEQPSCLRAEELSESGPDPKLRPIPRIVVKQIRNILYSYPKGIPITELRSELAKSNVGVDRDFYGYKKFSRFLLAMPQILKLQSANDGQFLVRGITQKVPEENESTSSTASRSVSDSGECNSVSIPKLNDEKTSATECVDEKLSLPSVQEPKMRSAPTKLQEPKVHELPKPYTEGVDDRLSPPSPESKVERPSRLRDLRKLQEPRGEAGELPREALEPSPLVQVVDYNDVMKSQLHAAEEHSSVSEPGIFKRIWKKWFGSEDGVLQGKESTEIDKMSGQNVNTEEKDVKVTSHSAELLTPPSVSPSIKKTITDDQFADCSDATIDNSRRVPSLFTQIMSWFSSWRSSHDSDGSCEESSREVNPTKIDSSSKQLFSKESFWSDIQSFLDTPQGSTLVLQSRTRVQMAHNLRKDGPSVLGSLSDDYLLQLIDLLISDKKWVEECGFLTFPFKLKQSAGKDTSNSNARCSSGLSSIFLDTQVQSSSLKKREPNGEKKYQNPPRTGVSQPVNQGKPSGKSRNEILADCQKLAEFIAKEYPEGFNMGSFRKLFLERYGYSLEIQNLGYQKLATLLQIMPGVRIESTYIVPSGKGFTSSGLDAGEDNGGLVANANNQLSDVLRKDDDSESPWEELGPIADADSKKETDAGLNKKAKDETNGQVNDYELVSDDDFSDSEDETLSSMKSEGEERRRKNEEDSSLLQILDSWYSSKEATNRKDKSEIVDGSGDSVKDDLAPSAAKNETAKLNYGQSKRLSKSYSFVADRRGDDKDKLIDGILGSLKKSGERSTEARV